MVICLASSQQRSGRGSPLQARADTQPFALRCSKFSEVRGRRRYALMQLHRIRGLRRAETIAQQITDNYVALEAGLLDPLAEQMHRLVPQASAEVEREGA